jgi:multidrug efflux pump subunit AcrA (membrane-fusion protein)
MLASLLLALSIAVEPAVGDPQIYDCVIASINDQPVPAADAGVITKLNVHEGMHVVAGQEIGAVDDNEARAMLQVKQLEYDVAQQKAESMVNIKHAEAAAAVASATLGYYEEANKKAAGTVSKAEMLKWQLEVTKTELATDQAREQQIEDALTAKAKKAEVHAAQVALDRRILKAPFDGVITSVEKKPGEWAAAGDPVVYVVGIHRLRVMGNLDASQWSLNDVADRPVTVTVQLPRGRTIDVPGKVTYVSPVVTLEHLPVWAEIDVPMENNLPVVRAGLKASMTIHVNRPPIQATAAPAPQTRPASATTRTSAPVGTVAPRRAK